MLFATMLFAAAAVLPDGGFENGISTWNADGRTWRVADGEGRAGSKALVWENSDPDTYRFASMKLPALPGGAFRFSGWIRVDSVTNAIPSRGRPHIMIDWRDRDGKWLSMTSASPVTDNQERRDGWIRYEGVTPYFPSSVGSASLICSVYRGSSGKVRFDDIEVSPLALKTVSSIVSSVYRDTAASGTVSFVASYNANPHTDPVDSLRGEFVFAGVDGALRIPAESMEDGSAKVSVRVGSLRMGGNPVRFELRRSDGRLLGERSCMFTRCAVLPARKVDIDRYGRTLVDGKPFFPLGMYSSARHHDELATYCEGPFNCILPYALPPESSALDVYHAHGLKVVVCVSDYVGFRNKTLKTSEDERRYAAGFAEAFRDHPALLAWYLADELPPAQSESLRARNMLFHEMDPDHPTWIVLDKPNNVRTFVEGFDIVGMDPYPIGNTTPGRNVGIEIASVWPQKAQKGMYGFRPMWQVPQAFSWAWVRKDEASNSNLRMPTRQEMLNMNWQAVAAGANGLVGWWFAGLLRELKHKDMEEFSRVWRDVKAAYGDVAAKVPLLLSVESAPKTRSVPKGIVVRTWSKDGCVWLLAVNATRSAVGGEIRVGDVKVRIDLKGLEHRWYNVRNR